MGMAGSQGSRGRPATTSPKANRTGTPHANQETIDQLEVRRRNCECFEDFRPVSSYRCREIARSICCELARTARAGCTRSQCSKKIILREQPAHIAVPVGLEAAEQFFGARVAAFDEIAERLEEAFFRRADFIRSHRRVFLRARSQARLRDREHVAREI